jgi:polar amino acid transport system substrate-binding protein
MKKLSKLSILLILAFGMLLSACGSSETSKGEDNNSSGGDEKKTLRVVTDAAYSPMEYQDQGKVVGFDIDLMKAIGEEAGYELKIEHVGWDPMLQEIKDGTADLAISSITINDDRKESYDFSVPYYLSRNEILVPEGSKIKSSADLKGKKIAVQKDTTGHEIAKSILGETSKDIKPFDTTPLAIQELINNGADAVLADKPVVEEYVKNNQKEKLVIITDDSFEPEYYGLMFPKGSKLVSDFDEAVNKLFDNGKYAEIFKEWFGTEPDIENLKAQQ